LKVSIRKHVEASEVFSSKMHMHFTDPCLDGLCEPSHDLLVVLLRIKNYLQILSGHSQNLVFLDFAQL
jgi:hypothetical protein